MIVYLQQVSLCSRISHHSCVWRRVGQSARLPPASGCACGLTPAPCCGRGGRWRWRSRCWWWGQSSREVTRWMSKREQRHDARWTEDADLLSHLNHMKMCEACIVVHVREECVSACNWVSMVSTPPSHSRLLRLAECETQSQQLLLQELSTKKNDSKWFSGLVVFEEFEVLDQATAPSCLVLERTRQRIWIVVTFLPIISQHIVLPIALVPWVPVWVQDGESHQLELGVQVEERDDGWSVKKFAFRLRSIQPNSYLGPLKEPFLCQDEVDHSIASWHLLGWIRFQHLFVTVPAYLSDIFRFLVPGSWRWGWPIQIFAKCS